jgi:hypothetical protein
MRPEFGVEREAVAMVEDGYGGMLGANGGESGEVESAWAPIARVAFQRAIAPAFPPRVGDTPPHTQGLPATGAKSWSGLRPREKIAQRFNAG